MIILEVGEPVTHLQFLPDSRRLLVTRAAPEGPTGLDVCTLPAGSRVPLKLPLLDRASWWYMSDGVWSAIHPSGEHGWLAWNARLYMFDTATGKARPGPKQVQAHQVIASPDGTRLATAYVTESDRHLSTLRTNGRTGNIHRRLLPPGFRHLAGFLADGKRIVTIDEGVSVIGADGEEDHPDVRARKCIGSRPQVSHDGRFLGVMGYGSMYLFDLTGTGKPGQIKGGQNFGDFRSFSFHPDGRRMAVIHGGPTLVKVYELPTLQRVDTYNWKLGPLESVAYSPDGTLGAARSRDGRIVVWDVE